MAFLLWNFRVLSSWQKPIARIEPIEASKIILDEGISLFDWVLVQENIPASYQLIESIVAKTKKHGSYQLLDELLLSKIVSWLQTQDNIDFEKIVSILEGAQISADNKASLLSNNLMTHNPQLAMEQISYIKELNNISHLALEKLHKKQILFGYMLGDKSIIEDAYKGWLANASLDNKHRTEVANRLQALQNQSTIYQGNTLSTFNKLVTSDRSMTLRTGQGQNYTTALTVTAQTRLRTLAIDDNAKWYVIIPPKEYKGQSKHLWVLAEDVYITDKVTTTTPTKTNTKQIAKHSSYTRISDKQAGSIKLESGLSLYDFVTTQKENTTTQSMEKLINYQSKYGTFEKLENTLQANLQANLAEILSTNWSVKQISQWLDTFNKTQEITIDWVSLALTSLEETNPNGLLQKVDFLLKNTDKQAQMQAIIHKKVASLITVGHFDKAQQAIKQWLEIFDINHPKREERIKQLQLLQQDNPHAVYQSLSLHLANTQIQPLTNNTNLYYTPNHKTKTVAFVSDKVNRFESVGTVTKNNQKYHLITPPAYIQTDSKHLYLLAKQAKSLNASAIQQANKAQQQALPETILKGHSEDINVIALGGDGEVLFSGDAGGALRLWSSSQNKQIKKLQGNFGFIIALDVSNDSRYAISGSDDGSIAIWDVRKMSLIKQIKAHKSYITALGFSPNAKHFISTSESGKIKIWSTKTGKLAHQFQAHDGLVSSLQYSPNGDILLSANDKEGIKLWNSRTYNLVKHLSSSSSSSQLVAFGASGEYILSSNANGDIKYWSVAEGTPLYQFATQYASLHTLALSPNEKYILLGGEKGVQLRELVSGKLIRSFDAHKAPIYSVVFGRNGNDAFSASGDRSIIKWNISEQLNKANK